MPAPLSIMPRVPSERSTQGNQTIKHLPTFCSASVIAARASSPLSDMYTLSHVPPRHPRPHSHHRQLSGTCRASAVPPTTVLARGGVGLPPTVGPGASGGTVALACSCSRVCPVQRRHRVRGQTAQIARSALLGNASFQRPRRLGPRTGVQKGMLAGLPLGEPLANSHGMIHTICRAAPIQFRQDQSDILHRM